MNDSLLAQAMRLETDEERREWFASLSGEQQDEVKFQVSRQVARLWETFQPIVEAVILAMKATKAASSDFAAAVEEEKHQAAQCNCHAVRSLGRRYWVCPVHGRQTAVIFTTEEP